MHTWVLPYASTVLAMGAAAGLLLLQLVILDVVGITARHTPGAPVVADHGNLFFRATRAHANTNESIAAFALLAVFGILSAASPSWLNGSSWVYVSARVGHMLCYYLGLQLPRSACFAVGLLALFVMLVVGLQAWT
jgi:uncharacterized MAPEG superfamily protein